MSSLIKEEVIEESALKFKPFLNLQILLKGQKGASYSQRPPQK